jgi:hypothetical protein
MDVRRRMSLGLVGLVVLTVSVGAVLAVTVWTGEDDGEAARAPRTPPVPSASAVGRICIGAGPDASAVCARVAEDRARRLPLTAEQEAELAEVARRVPVTFPPLPEAGRRCDGPEGPCTVDYGPVDEAYVAAVRAAVVEAGYPDTMLRVARADDPAPEGSLLYGIPVGAGCVVGYHGAGGGSHEEVGALPDGGCLAP